MIGFLIGTACLIGLFKVLRAGRGCGGWGRRSWGSYGGFGGHGPHGSHGWHGSHGSHGGYGHRHFGPRMFLRGLFERLETTPGQEKVIIAAVEELWTKKQTLREELDKSRADIARAVGTGLFDDTALNDAFARHDALLVELRDVVTRSLRNIHEALDDAQRKTFAELIEHGFFRRWGGERHEGGFGGPYRSAWM